MSTPDDAEIDAAAAAINDWDWRVVRHEEEGRTWYGIHEVYFGKGGTVLTMTEDPIEPYGDTLEEIIQDLRDMLKVAETGLVVEYDRFGAEPPKEAM